MSRIDEIAEAHKRGIVRSVRNAWRGGRTLDEAIDHAAYSEWAQTDSRWQGESFETILWAFRRVAAQSL